MKLGVVAGALGLVAVLSCGKEGRNFADGGAGSSAQGGDNSAGWVAKAEAPGSQSRRLAVAAARGSRRRRLAATEAAARDQPSRPRGPGAGQLGEPCSEAGARACAGHAQREQLLCEAGAWKSNGSCPAGQHCDTREGANQGLCQPVVADCEGQPTGTPICRDNNVELLRRGSGEHDLADGVHLL